MNGLKTDERDVLSYVRPDTLWGALAYLVIFIALAMLLSRALRAAVHAAMTRNGHLDRTSISFLQQICTALIWVLMVILYARSRHCDRWVRHCWRAPALRRSS